MTRLSDRELIELARDALTTVEFQVWILKHHGEYGRRTGSLALGITEAQWRYRLVRATRKLERALEERSEAA